MRRKTLIGALPILAKARANDAGVKLVIGGNQAATDGKTIYLPGLATGDDEATIYAMGYLGHEAAHCKHTDFDAVRQHDLTPFEKALENCIEDPRIEKIEGARYPGIRADLTRLVEKLLSDGDFTPDENATAQKLLPMYVNLRLRQIHTGQQSVGACADQHRNLLAKLIPKGAVVRLETMLPECMAAQNSADVCVIAKQLAAMLKEEAEKAAEPPPPPPPSSSQMQQGNGGGEGQTQTGQSDQNTDSDQAQQEGQSQLQQSSQEKGQMGQTQGPSVGGDAAKAANLLNAIASSDPAYEGLGEIAKNKLEKKARVAHGMVRDFEIRNCISRGGNTALLDVVRVETSALRRRIAALVQSKAQQSVSIKNRGRRLSAPHLSRIKCGDDRVFRKVSEGTGVDTAVSILIDASGSMSGEGRYELAKHSAAAVALALEGVQGAATEILKFPFVGGLGAEVLTPFGATMRQTANNLATSSPSGGTPMAEAMLAAGQSLHARNEHRKMMLVMHDGEPNSPEVCKQLVGDLEKMGIEVYGVGIKCDTKHIFHRSTLVWETKELPKAIFGLIEKSISQ